MRSVLVSLAFLALSPIPTAKAQTTRIKVDPTRQSVSVTPNIPASGDAHLHVYSACDPTKASLSDSHTVHPADPSSQPVSIDPPPAHTRQQRLRHRNL